MTKQTEFIAICSILMSSVALSIDILLPSLGEIATTFGLIDDNDRQLTVVILFVGLTIGQLIFGPCSDSTGRKPMIFLGLALFCVGSVICTFANSFEILLWGRAVQGVGAAGPRVVTVALIRDRFEGQKMAQILSIIMGVFILVPILAPSLGQILLFLMPWRGLFLFLACIGLFGGAWLALRQEETLKDKSSFSVKTYFNAFKEVCTSPLPMAYALAGALCYGALMGYINTSQQLFQDTYDLGESYPLWFGVSAAFISVATFINAKLVANIRMEFICFTAMATLVAWASIFGLIFSQQNHLPEPGIWMVFNCICLFLLGLTFGNFNAIALRSFGHIAGVASAIVSAINSALSLVIAWIIGNGFDGSVSTMVYGYVVCCILAIVSILLIDKAQLWRRYKIAK